MLSMNKIKEKPGKRSLRNEDGTTINEWESRGICKRKQSLNKHKQTQIFWNFLPFLFWMLRKRKLLLLTSKAKHFCERLVVGWSCMDNSIIT